MTLALVTALVVLVALVGWRLYRLPRALRAARVQALVGETVATHASTLQALSVKEPPVLKATSHRVFSGPLEHNEHGFITTPMVACTNPDCHCRKMFPPTP